MKKELKSVMSVVYELCKSDGTGLLSLDEIIAEIPHKIKISLREVESSLFKLEESGYLEVLKIEKNNKNYFLITLKNHGLIFDKSLKEEKKRKRVKIITWIVSVFASFLITTLLRIILKA